MMVMRFAWTPCETRVVHRPLGTALASARLYSLVPRSSQCPSINKRLSAFVFSHAALARGSWRFGSESNLSKSNEDVLQGRSRLNSVGDGRAAGAARSRGVGAGARR